PSIQDSTYPPSTLFYHQRPRKPAALAGRRSGPWPVPPNGVSATRGPANLRFTRAMSALHHNSVLKSVVRASADPALGPKSTATRPIIAGPPHVRSPKLASISAVDPCTVNEIPRLLQELRSNSIQLFTGINDSMLRDVMTAAADDCDSGVSRPVLF